MATKSTGFFFRPQEEESEWWLQPHLDHKYCNLAALPLYNIVRKNILKAENNKNQ